MSEIIRRNYEAYERVRRAQLINQLVSEAIVGAAVGLAVADAMVGMFLPPPERKP